MSCSIEVGIDESVYALRVPYGKLQRAQHKVFERRNAVESAQVEVCASLDYIQESQKELNEGIEGYLERLSLSAETLDFREKWHQFGKDCAQAQEHIRRAHKLQEALLAAELKLQRRHGQMLNKLAGLRPLEEDLYGGAVSTTVSDTDTSAQDESQKYPPLLEDYFDKVGTMGYLEERLFETDDSYKAACADRQFKEDHGEPLEESPLAFRLRWKKEFRERTEEYEAINELAKEARDGCIQNGLLQASVCDEPRWAQPILSPFQAGPDVTEVGSSKTAEKLPESDVDPQPETPRNLPRLNGSSVDNLSGPLYANGISQQVGDSEQERDQEIVLWRNSISPGHVQDVTRTELKEHLWQANSHHWEEKLHRERAIGFYGPVFPYPTHEYQHNLWQLCRRTRSC